MKLFYSLLLFIFSISAQSQQLPGFTYMKKLPKEIQNVNGAVILVIQDETQAILTSDGSGNGSSTFENIANKIHNSMLDLGFSIQLIYPMEYFGRDEAALNDVNELYEKHDIHYVITYTVSNDDILTFSYMDGIQPFYGDVTYSDIRMLDPIPGSDYEGIFADFKGVCKKSKLILDAPTPYYEPEILYKDPRPKGEVIDQIPNLKGARIFIEMDSFRPPISDNMSESQKAFYEKINQDADDRAMRIKEIIAAYPELNLLTYDPSIEKIEFTENDYYIESYSNPKSIRTIEFSRLLNVYGVIQSETKESSEVAWYMCYYLRNMKTNDLFFEDYGDYKGDESFTAFLSYIMDKQ